MGFHIALCASPLEREQALDLRRSILCGELHLSREVVDDGQDGDADLALVLDQAAPIATGRLLRREGLWVVEHLAVRPARRRAGVGRALVEFLLERCRDRGGDCVHAVSPAEASAFFSGLGFEQIGETGEGARLEAWRRAI